MRQAKHQCDTHQSVIDQDTVNDTGLPALVCAECITKKGPRKGKPKFICWMSEKDMCMIQYGADWQTEYAKILDQKQVLEYVKKGTQNPYAPEPVPGNDTAYT